MPSSEQAASPPQASRRISTSEIVRMLLTRSGSEHSSVSLTRNAKGETQIEVVVRTGDGEESPGTVQDAAAIARSVYDTLRSAYPLASGTTGAVQP